MWSITVLRQCELFAPLFERVHPLCWPILWWNLNRLVRWLYANTPEDILFETNSWGMITIRYVAPRRDPTLYKPLERTFRPLSDPSWESDLPSNLAALETLRLILFLPRAAGGGGIPRSGMTEGVRRDSDCTAIARRTTLTPNTS